MFTLILLTLLLTFLKAIDFIYLFQIKEYRFDRFFSFMKEVGLQKIVYSPQIRYPAKSFRNIVIVLYILATLSLLLLVAIEISSIYYFLTFILPFSPILSLAIVIIGVFFTKFPVYIQRQLIIARAKFKVKHSEAFFIGITGSYGKTSVKEYIYELLSSQLHAAKTDENHNTDVGVALSILKNLKKTTSYFVAEFGAYKKGEIKKASSYIPLYFAVLTGLGNQHLDLYGSKENLIEEETYLLKTVPEEGTVYLPFDIPEKKRIVKQIKAHIVQYGLEADSDIRAVFHSSDPHIQTAQITYKDHSFTIFTRLLGTHTVKNLLPAIAVSLDLGIKPKNIINTIQSLQQIPGKLSLHKGVKKATILNDAVNSNVDGFIAALQTLNTFSQKNKIVVSQGIIELGVEKRSSYEKILDKLEQSNAILYTTDTVFSELQDDDRVITFNDVSQLTKALLNSIDSHTIILLEGKFPKQFMDSLIV